VRVLFVLDSLGAGGAERSTALVLPFLRDRGVEATVALLRSESEGSEAEVRAGGFDVRVLPPGNHLSTARTLRDLILEQRAEIIHTAIYAADQIGRLASIGTGAHVVSSLVNVPRLRRFRTPADPPAWKIDLVNVLDAATGRLLVDRYHAVTPGVAQLYTKAYRIRPTRVTVVERGRPLDSLGERTHERRVAVRAALGLTLEDRIVVAAGRQEHQKAHVDLVRAVSKLAAADRRIHLLIAGRDGNASPDLHRTLEGISGAGRFIHLLGHRSDVPDLLAAADVMALPSVFEGTAGIALEAMAIGTPIVSTRLEGMLGILEDERNALIVEPRDPTAMASAIGRLLDNEVLALRLAQEAQRDFHDRFTLERSADRTVELYRSVLSDG
jgi:glycosyltransferase involved in cell wall biosynthesis